MQDVDKVVEEVFQVIKKEKAIYYKRLYEEVNAEHQDIEWAWNKLHSNYKLILSDKKEFSLSEKGEIHNSVKDYLKSLKHKKDYLKIIAIILTVLFGIAAIYQKYDYRDLKQDYHSLKSSNDSLQSQNLSYKDSLIQMKYELKQLDKPN